MSPAPGSRTATKNRAQSDSFAKSKAPLAGLRCLELCSVLAGPSTGQLLAELGCEVIKVENPRTGGDVTRTWHGGDLETEVSPASYFQSCNLGKKSILLDFGSSNGRTVFKNLLRHSDIVLASYKERADAKKLGVDFDDCVQIIKEEEQQQEQSGTVDHQDASNHPGLIYAALTGYGGVEDARPGYDACVQAEAGFMYLNREENNCASSSANDPLKMPVALMDLLAAHQMKQGILLALYERAKSTAKQHKLLEVSLMRSAVVALANQAGKFLLTKQIPQPLGSDHPSIVPYGTVFYDSARKPFVLAVGTDAQFAKLYREFVVGSKHGGGGHDETEKMPANWATNNGRCADRDSVKTCLQTAFSSSAREHVLQKCGELGIPAGAVNRMDEVFVHPEAKAALLSKEEGVYVSQVGWNATAGTGPFLDVRVTDIRRMGDTLSFMDATTVLDGEQKLVELVMPGNLQSTELRTPSDEDVVGQEAHHLLRNLDDVAVEEDRPAGGERKLVPCVTKVEKQSQNTADDQPPSAPTTKDVRPGDVLRLLAFRQEKGKPRAPRETILNVEHFVLLEKWKAVAKGFPFQPSSKFSNPNKLTGKSKKTLAQQELHLKIEGATAALPKQQNTREEDDNREDSEDTPCGTSAKSKRKTRGKTRPAMILQCHLGLWDRIATLFDGEVAANSTKDRLVLVYDDDDADGDVFWFKRQLLDLRRRSLVDSTPSSKFVPSGIPLPDFLKSAIHRVYFCDDGADAVFVSREAALAHVLALDRSSIGSEQEQQFVLEDPRQSEKRAMCFPREVQDELFQRRLAAFQKQSAQGTTRVVTTPPQSRREKCSSSKNRLEETADVRQSSDESSCTPTKGTGLKETTGTSTKAAQNGVATPGSSSRHHGSGSRTHYFELCDSIVYADGVHYVGTNQPRVIIPERLTSLVPSSAFFKLTEIDDRYVLPKLGVQGRERYVNCDYVVDVGASPGGWTLALATVFRAKTVCAIDPAEHMHASVAKLLSAQIRVTELGHGADCRFYNETPVAAEGGEIDDNECSTNPMDPSAGGRKTAAAGIATSKRCVRHYVMPGDAGLVAMREEKEPPKGSQIGVKMGAESAAGSRISSKVGIFVCDINDAPAVAVSHFEMAALGHERLDLTWWNQNCACSGSPSIETTETTQTKSGETAGTTSAAAEKNDNEDVLLRAPCLVVITMKNGFGGRRDRVAPAGGTDVGAPRVAAQAWDFASGGGKRKFASQVSLAKQRLAQLGVVNLEEIHLFANTRNETTLVGEWRGQEQQGASE
eukprot:g567.t1